MEEVKGGVMEFFKVNPLDWFRGAIKFPIGPFKASECDCSSCQGRTGWGVMFLFFGVIFMWGVK